VGLLVAIPLIAALGTVHAQNATWLVNPGSGDWNTSTNWTPQTVPTATASFGSSNTTSITFSSTAVIGEMLFTAGAPAYSFANTNGDTLIITSAGIVNNSSSVLTIIRNFPGTTQFINASTAGNATITNDINGVTQFFDESTAGNATIMNNGGMTEFNNTSTGGDARFITNAGGNLDIPF
jgi:hypothetical protein